MAWLRAVVRTGLVGFFTLISYLAAVGGKVVLPLFGRQPYRWMAACYRFWGRSLIRVLGIEVEVRGAPPQPPYLMVSNHQSYIDIFLLARELGSCFVAKAEIDGWPAFGTICRGVDTVFINRENRRDVVRVGRTIQEFQDAGRGLVLFAEGTTSNGESMLPFKTPLLAPAARLDLPVHHVTLSYSTAPGDPSTRMAVCWWGDMTLLDHFFALARIRRFYATVHFGDEPIQDPDRKLLAERLREAMLLRFTPVTAPEEA